MYKCTVLFEGEFKGDIDFNITKRTLFAEGKNSFSGRQFMLMKLLNAMVKEENLIALPLN
jgi:hypothetical protein